MSPTIKGDDTADQSALLWACVACDTQGRLRPPPLRWTSMVVVKTQLEIGLVSKEVALR